MFSRAKASNAASGTICSPVRKTRPEKWPTKNPRALFSVSRSGNTMVIMFSRSNECVQSAISRKPECGDSCFELFYRLLHEFSQNSRVLFEPVFAIRPQPIGPGSRRFRLLQTELFDHLFPNLELLNLSGHGLRKTVDEFYVTRHFVMGQVRPAIGAQFVGVERPTGF